jgi:hypothetical protein
MSWKTRSARADRSIVHTWDFGMPSEAEPYTLVQVTPRPALGCNSGRRLQLRGRGTNPLAREKEARAPAANRGGGNHVD